MSNNQQAETQGFEMDHGYGELLDVEDLGSSFSDLPSPGTSGLTPRKQMKFPIPQTPSFTPGVETNPPIPRTPGLTPDGQTEGDISDFQLDPDLFSTGQFDFLEGGDFSDMMIDFETVTPAHSGENKAKQESSEGEIETCFARFQKHDREIEKLVAYCKNLNPWLQEVALLMRSIRNEIQNVATKSSSS